MAADRYQRHPECDGQPGGQLLQGKPGGQDEGLGQGPQRDYRLQWGGKTIVNSIVMLFTWLPFQFDFQ